MPIFLTIFFILLLITLGQTAIDVYLPSLPSMTTALHTNSQLVQQTMTTFLLGFSLSQLFYGPLSDRYGRKPILLFGLILFLVSSIACARATTIEILILARLFQGLGAGAASVLSRAIMRDCFSGKALARVASFAAMGWSVVPLCAPVLGGYFEHYFSWKASFWFITLLSAATFLFCFFLFEETKDQNYSEPIELKNVLLNYKSLLSSPIFIGNIFCIIMMYNLMVAFNLMAPFILQNLLGLKPVAYGWVIIFVTAGYLLGSWINSLLSQHIHTAILTISGLLILWLAAVCMLALALDGLLNLWAIVVPVFVILTASAVVYPNATSASLQPFAKLAGSAGALYGFIVILCGSFTSNLVAYLPEKSQLPLAIVMLLLASLAFIGYIWFYFWQKTHSIVGEST